MASLLSLFSFYLSNLSLYPHPLSPSSLLSPSLYITALLSLYISLSLSLYLLPHIFSLSSLSPLSSDLSLLLSLSLLCLSLSLPFYSLSLASIIISLSLSHSLSLSLSLLHLSLSYLYLSLSPSLSLLPRVWVSGLDQGSSAQGLMSLAFYWRWSSERW